MLQSLRAAAGVPETHAPTFGDLFRQYWPLVVLFGLQGPGQLYQLIRWLRNGFRQDPPDRPAGGGGGGTASTPVATPTATPANPPTQRVTTETLVDVTPPPDHWYDRAARWISDNGQAVGWGVLGVLAAAATAVLVLDDTTGVGAADDPLIGVTGPAAATAFARAGALFRW